MDGNEVTQKIRVAIKTKLVELGAYVDDELPDYIMVMIANKKTKEQMARDLSLFLGESTANFTNWLQGVLDHLQAIASEAKRPKSEVRAEGPVLPPHLEYTPREVLPRGKVPEVRGDGVYSDEVLALKAEPEPDDDLADDLHSSADTPPGKQMAPSSVSLVRPIPRVMGPEPAQAHAVPSKQVEPPKKPASSSSSSVRRRPQFISDEEEEEEEEYDPTNPSVSSVASVVKVSERRSSVPQGMQANKLLLLKAMKAAHQSVSTSATARTRRNPSARVEPYQPTPIRELTTKRRRPGCPAQGQKEEDEAVPPKRSTGLSIKDRLGHRVAAALPEDNLPTVDPERAPGRTSRLVGAIAPEVRPREEVAPVAAPVQEATAPVTTNVELEQEEDSDLLELEVPREEVHLVVKDGTPTSTPGRASAPEDASRRGEKWPHFVVTLNGVDPASFKSGTREVVAHHASGPGDLDELPEYVEEDGNGYPPRRDDSMVAEDTVLEEELEEEPMLVEEGPSKLLEKCRYWPACKNGDRCPYHHPSVPCKAFPNCKFRDKCLFIHPNCKYDAFCKNKNCPFTHASRRSFACPPLPTSSPSVQHCKFYPHCTNTKCPFFHPKPCRFGAMCQAPSCPYTHPESSIPPPNKLKWTSATAKKAGETAA